MRLGQLITATALGLALAVASGAPAHADDDLGNEGGGGINTDTVPADVARRADDKQALAAAYVAAKQDKGSVSAFEQAARDYAVKHDDESVLASSKDPSMMSAAATDKVLAVAHYAQIDSYFCGPGSGKMILKYMRAGSSAYNGSPQDPDHIGGPGHMRTWANGTTAWDSGRFRIGLNRWREGKDDGYYVDKHDPTVTYFKNSLTYGVDYGFPLGADTVEFKGGTHYNGHPNLKIGHWIVGHGYYDDAGRTRFADPAAPDLYPNASKHFSYNTSDFVNRFLEYNGITW